MPYDQMGNYSPGEDVPFDPGAGVNGPQGTLTLKDVGDTARVVADDLLDFAPSMLQGARSVDNAWNALKNYAASRLMGQKTTYGQEFLNESGRQQQQVVDKGIKKLKDADDVVTGAIPEEERSIGQNVAGIIGTAFLPGKALSVFDKFGPVGRGVNKVLDATRNPFTDLIDPRTTHYTPTGIAINAGIGAAGDAAIEMNMRPPESQIENEAKVYPQVQNEVKTATAMPADPDSSGAPTTVVDASPKTDEGNIPVDKANTAAGAVGITTAIVPWLAMLGMRTHTPVANAALHAASIAEKDSLSVRGGPVHVEEKVPGANPVAQAFDEQAPAESAIVAAGGTASEARAINTDANKNLRTNVAHSVKAAKTYGQLDGVNKPVPSILKQSEAVAAFEKQFPGQSADLHQYMQYKNALADRTDYAQGIVQQMGDLDVSLTALRQQALTPLPARKLQSVLDQIDDFTTQKGQLKNKLDEFTKDTPETRPSLTDLSTPDMMAVVAKGDADPRFEPFRKMQKDFNDGIVDYNINNGLVEPELGRLLKQKGDSHVLLKDDPYASSTTRLGRAAAIIKKNVSTFSDEMFEAHGRDNQGNNAVESIGKRDLQNEVQGNKINNPLNFIDSNSLALEQAVRYGARQSYVRDIVDAITSKPKWTDVLNVKNTSSGNPLWSAKQVKAQIGKSINLKTDVLVNRGGKFQVVTPKDPKLKALFDQPPVMTIPVLRTMKGFVQKGATGILNPLFKPVAAAYDGGLATITRPAGMVHGWDAMTNAAARGLGFKQSPQWLDMVARFGSFPIIPGGDFTGIMAMSMKAAVTTFMQQNARNIVGVMVGEMERNSSILAGIRKVQPQFLENWANRMMHTYEETLFHAAIDNKILEPADFHNYVNAGRAYEKKMGRMTEKAWHTPIGKMANAVLWQYHNVLGSIESSVRMSGFISNAAREMAIEGVDHWKDLSKAAQNRVTRYARTGTADFSRTPSRYNLGGQTVQAANSATPYLNVMARSIQSIYRAMKEEPATVGAAIMSGVVLPRVMAEYMLSNWDDNAHKHWFEDTPLFDRIASMPVITPGGLLAYHNGEPFDPAKHLWKFTMMPESRAISTFVSEGLRTLGMYGKRSFGSNINDPTMITMLDALGEGFKQAFAPNNIPLLDAASKASGVEINPGFVFSLPAQFADNYINGPAAQHRPGFLDPSKSNYQNRAGAQTAYNPTSNIQQNTASVISSLFGTFGGVMTEMFDTYNQKREGGEGIGAAAAGALGAGWTKEKEIGTKTLKKSVGPAANLFLDGQEQLYRNTPTSQYIRDARSTFSLVSGKNMQIKPTQIIDDGGVLDQLASQLRFDLKTDHEMKDFGQQFVEINNQLKQLSANRKIDPDARSLMNRQLMEQLQGINRDQAAHIQEMEKQYLEDYGDEFRKRFGVQLSFASMRAFMTKAGNKAKYQPSPD